MILHQIQVLESEFEKHRNESEAEGMSRYMKNRFTYFGIKKPKRAEIQKEWFSSLPKDFSPDKKRELILELWQKEEREFHYVAMDFIAKWKDSELTIEDTSLLEFLLTNHSWWDSEIP
ncbi:MAG: DNA alkylation repair protein [Crocinitomicaceae bacterium]